MNPTKLFEVPLLLLVFNKPDAVYRVFEAIRLLKPRNLYIAADGPRPDVAGESDKCQKVRQIVEQIEWDCSLHKRFLPHNQGCKKAVSTAISWFFDNVSEGIILEEDCLPDPSFFIFCQALLERYRDDQRIMMISGNNFQDGKPRGDGSYYFSRYANIWGWATWRRAWAKYDSEMSSFKTFLKKRQIENVFADEREQKFWLKQFKRVYSNKLDTWDYIWAYTLFCEGGLSVTPNSNLVSNIGFGIPEATHTKDYHTNVADLPSETMKTIVHPQFVIRDRKADQYTFKTVFKLRKKKGKLERVVNKLL